MSEDQLPPAPPEDLRPWGLYLIPRDKAPTDEGFLMTRNQRGHLVYRAHHVEQCKDGVPPKGVKDAVAVAPTLEALIDKLEDLT